MAPIILFFVILVLMSDVFASGESLSLYMLAMDMMPSVVAMWLVASSFSGTGMAKWTVRILLVVNLMLLSFHICRLAGMSGNLTDRNAMTILSLSAALLFILFIFLLADRVHDIKAIMKNGVVWAVVCLVVDVAYLCFIMGAVAVMQIRGVLIGVLMLGGAVTAIGLRIMTDSKFLIWQRQERIIVESMKITSLPSASDASRIEDVYKDLYERVVTYFEEEKPFLDSDLTINAVVRSLYSNKLYLSRSINQFTGRNFCQFVNYYRVMHSMESFRGNPELKVHELATMSGFNSVVSFNMAFRLFMGENPSEWCRKEKSRIIKTEK